MSSPLTISLTVALSATLLAFLPALGVAWILTRSRLPGKGLLHALVLAPVAVPPVVTGYFLLGIFAPTGTLGTALAAIGIPVAFHWAGAVLAAAVVGFPFLTLSTVEAFKSVDSRLEAVSRSLGHGPASTFAKVTLPLSWPGILAGSLIAFARGLGEFGATIVLAGRIPGVTETLPLAIFAALERPGGEAQAWSLAWSAALLGVGCVFGARVLDGWWKRRMGIAP